MSVYLRYYVPGGTYFFTIVTAGRTPLFASPVARATLGRIMRTFFERYPVQVIAIVLLPDHLHTLWALPAGDAAYSRRWQWIKREFTRAWLAGSGCEHAVSESARAERRRGVWQRRFWEHTIRDEADLESHSDYIHYNPVKHGLVAKPGDWPWSSFHRWVRAGCYRPDWACCTRPIPLPRNAGE
jgi:putative transposase